MENQYPFTHIKELQEQINKMSEQLCYLVNVMKKHTFSEVQSTGGHDDQLLTHSEAADFLCISKSGLYGLNTRGKIERYKSGKRCLYRKSALVNYLKSKVIPTYEEILKAKKEALKRKGRKK